MAINTLAEGNKYSTTSLDHMVIDRLVKQSRILQSLPFEQLLGNSLTYDTITTDSGAAWYSPGDTWTESTPVLTQATVTLKIIGGDIELDNFVVSTRSDQIDLAGVVIDNKIKAVRYEFMDTFYYGAVASNSKQFDGLQTLIANTTYNTVHAGSSTGTALSVAKLREALDLMRQAGHTPGIMTLSYALRRGISTYLDSVGSAYPRAVNAFGANVDTFDGVELAPDAHIVDTETAASGAYSAKTGGGNTTIFILSFGPQYCSGVQGKNGIETIPLGDMETKDAKLIRIRWYTGLKFEDIRSCAKVDGIDSDGTVTA